MRRAMKRRLRKEESAVAPVIGVILLLAIMLSIVGGILLWGIPLLRNMENEARFDSARSNFYVLDSRTEELMQEGEGSSRTSTISLAGGELFITNNMERWVVFYALVPLNVTFENLTDGDNKFDFYFDNQTYNSRDMNVTVLWRDNGTALNYTSENGHVVADYPLSESIGIFVAENETGGGAPLAECFMDYLGGIQYRQQLENRRVEIRAVNGGLVSDQGTTRGQVLSSPLMVESISGNSRTINMFLVDMKARGIGSGGRGTYDISMNYAHGEVLAARTVYGLTVEMDSPFSFGYYFHFLERHDFIAKNDENGRLVAAVFAPAFEYESFLVLNYVMLEVETTAS